MIHTYILSRFSIALVHIHTIGRSQSYVTLESSPAHLQRTVLVRYHFTKACTCDHLHGKGAIVHAISGDSISSKDEQDEKKVFYVSE
ncbi:hypothetical protein EYC84_004025 [Monilinia fructicola]|uniref:Uncharacterized protein n=1 Tax=Monilinia fructicola TaxID=38448 RepID=A0A5M9K3N7_MONFR|nr:hypothetical protein EYC84_004025 [Monilinia fructicola]